MDVERLTGEELAARLLRLRGRERRLEVQVLRALTELDRRKLYLDWGYASLFAYCVERLGYGLSDRGGVGDERVPRIEALLLSGEVRLTTVAMAVGEALREKFERARALLSKKHPEGVACEQVFEAALDEHLKRHVPTAHSPRGE